MSPIDGPPKHLRISEEEPPSSETGRTNAGESPKAEANELAPVPPDMTRNESREFRVASIGKDTPGWSMGAISVSRVPIGELNMASSGCVSRSNSALITVPQFRPLNARF